MKYELEVFSDCECRVRKIMSVELWNSNQIFENLSELKKYLSDFVDLPFSINEVEDRINATAMDSWILFE